MESRPAPTKSTTPRRVHLTGIAGGEQPRMCTLERALEYRNEHILYKFQERWDVTFEEAAELFEETKKWLWVQVAARHRQGPPMAMTESLCGGRQPTKGSPLTSEETIMKGAKPVDSKQAVIQKLVKQNLANINWDCISLCCIGC